jgi:tRNA U34 2-thiouridine synthase MnmA/TrmU
MGRLRPRPKLCSLGLQTVKYRESDFVCFILTRNLMGFIGFYIEITVITCEVS